ncbi:MAG: hypothetical protein AAB801_00040, partial [Patescibacteria group bacterium]
IILFVVFILLPTGRVSFNAFYYQLVGLDGLSIASFAGFSMLAGILISAQVYLIWQAHQSRKKRAGFGIFSLFFSFIAGVFGSGVCAICLAVLLGFLGIPLIILTFLLDHQLEFLALASFIVVTQLYFSSRAIIAHKTGCRVCKVG